MTYEYSDASGYVGVPTKIRRSNTGCGVVPIDINSGEVEIRTYVLGESQRLQSIERRNGGTTEFTYTGFTYDRDRRLTSASTIDSATPFTFGFTDVLPSSTVAPGGPAAGSWRTDTTADAIARPTSLLRFIDATNKQTYTYSYATSASPRPTQLARGFNGSSTSLTTFIYDDFGRLVETTVPEAGAPGSAAPTRYEYDVASRMVKKRIGVGTAGVRTSVYTYDSLGRTTFVDNDTEHPVNCVGAADGTPIQDEEYKYDACPGPDVPSGVTCGYALGRLTISRAILQCSSNQVVKRGRWYKYDIAGRIQSVSYATVTGTTVGAAATSSLEYTTAGRLSSLGSPLNVLYATEYTFGAADGRATAVTTAHTTSSIASSLQYRAFGPISRLFTPIVQTVAGGTRTLVMNAAYRTDNSIATLDWSLLRASGTVQPISLVKPTMSYGPAGLISTRTDAADIASSRYYGYDALLRLTCEARGGGTIQPSSADCVTTSIRIGGLFTYGNGQSATSPPDVRLTSYIKKAGTDGASYTSPSTETYTYLSGSGQAQQINRTGSNIVLGYDTLGRRSFDYDSSDATKSRRDYTYLPNGELGSVSGQSSTGVPYSIVVRYDAEGHPVTLTNGATSYELFWDGSDRLIATSINSGAIRWHYHYLGGTLLAATREISGAVKRFWFASDERGLPYRVLDDQGATFWQARWDATGWRQIVGAPQTSMWIPFALPGQILLEGTAAFAGTVGDEHAPRLPSIAGAPMTLYSGHSFSRMKRIRPVGSARKAMFLPATIWWP